VRRRRWWAAGKAQDREALRESRFEPGGEFGGAGGVGGVGGDEFVEAALGAGAIGAGKDAAQFGGDWGAHLEARHVGLGVLLEMELAALPGHGREDGAAGGGEAGMVVGDQELESRGGGGE